MVNGSVTAELSGFITSEIENEKLPPGKFSDENP